MNLKRDFKMSKQDVLFKQMAVRVLMAEIDLRNVYEYGKDSKFGVFNNNNNNNNNNNKNT